MHILELIRLEVSSQGTIGILKFNKEVFCFTIEPPDKSNARNISSIPPGQYLCTTFTSKRHGDTYILDEVYGRTGILFHAGNTVGNTSGCILLGSKVGKLKENRAVLNSGKTFFDFIEKANGEKLHLTITEVY